MMKRMCGIVIVLFLFAGFGVTGAYAAGPTLLAPVQDCESTSSPVFEWTEDDFDFFVFIVVFKVAGMSYTLEWFPYAGTSFAMPAATWGMVEAGSTVYWGVIGIDFSATPKGSWSGAWSLVKFLPNDCGGVCWPELQGCDLGYCFKTADGYGNCVPDFWCGQACTTNADCGCGRLCYVCTACGIDGTTCGPIR